MRFLTLSICAALLLSGCPDPEPGGDAGPGGGSDAGPGAGDAGPGGGADAGPGADAARCHALASSIATACNGQADRTCEWNAVGDYCDTEDPAALADAFQCLLDASTGTGSCRTFSDPSAADVCVQSALTAGVSADEQAIADRVAMFCSESADDALFRSVLPVAALSSATATRLRACVDAALDCTGVQACFASDLAPIVACYAPAGDCAARAAEIATACNGQVDRTCLWEEYGALCGTENDEAFTAAMDCILAGSTGTGSCRTFSDPSGTDVCTQAALSGYVTAAAQSIASQLSTLCGTNSDDALYRFEPPLAALGTATLSSIDGCLAGALDCTDAEACFASVRANLEACF
ncbi:MAG: hypothetical protein AB7S26_35460 [Sandaracinaceae bacterium]